MTPTPKPVTWEQSENLETWFRRMLAEGKQSEAVQLIKLLPEHKREKYRRIYSELRREKFDGA